MWTLSFAFSEEVHSLLLASQRWMDEWDSTLIGRRSTVGKGLRSSDSFPAYIQVPASSRNVLCSSNHRTNHRHPWIFYTSTGSKKKNAQVHSAILHYLSAGALCPVQPRCCTSRNVKDSSKNWGGGFMQEEMSFVIFVLHVLIQKPSAQYCPTTPPIRRFINHHQLAPVASFLASNQKPSNIFQHLRKPPAMVLMLQQKWRSTELEEKFENPVKRKTKAIYRIL